MPSMVKSRFVVVSSAVVFSLALLCAVEVLWAVRSYRDMRVTYRRQVESVLGEATLRYMDNATPDASVITIGNIERLNALVGEGLRTAGIDTEYKVEVLSTTDAAALSLMAMGEVQTNKRCMVVERNYLPVIMRLTVEDPHDTILHRMRWMLLLQGLSIVVLIFAFIFMLRTLFRAKSVERIRRDLTHNITHELKTPIAAAYAATDMLRTTPEIAEDAARRDEYLDMTLVELKRLGGMVDEILRNSTESHTSIQLRREVCLLKDIVDEVVAAVTLKYASIDVQWLVHVGSDIDIVTDRFHLAGAISAIVDNAVKYSGRDAVVSITATTSGDYVCLAIEDNGCGIARRERRRIFDKFYRVWQGNRHDSRGYGLGLYYANSVIRRHGGHISVRSEVGTGSCFTLKLPRYGK